MRVKAASLNRADLASLGAKDGTVIGRSGAWQLDRAVEPDARAAGAQRRLGKLRELAPAGVCTNAIRIPINESDCAFGIPVAE